MMPALWLPLAAFASTDTRRSAKVFVDKRDIMQAVVMLNDGYTDQPYCAVNNAVRPQEWSCVVTGHLAHGETGGGQHVMSVISIDEG